MLVIAAAKFRHGAVTVQGFASLPLVETKVRWIVSFGEAGSAAGPATRAGAVGCHSETFGEVPPEIAGPVAAKAANAAVTSPAAISAVLRPIRSSSN